MILQKQKLPDQTFLDTDKCGHPNISLHLPTKRWRILWAGELFVRLTGKFVFNITKMIEHIKNNSDEIDLVEVKVADFPKSFSSIDESYVDSVDVSLPVLLAEISPGHYNLIDGNHRMEKARRMEIGSILAYKLNVKQHIKFLTKKDAYLSYIEYWNSKLKKLALKAC